MAMNGSSGKRTGTWRIRAGAAMAGLALLLTGTVARGMEVTPFRTGNMAPLVQIHGLPVPDSARILASREGEVSAVADLSNNYAVDSKGNEHIILDGETYRFALDLRYGLVPGVEAGIEIPFIVQSGGFLDGFIEWFHKAFGFTNGGREYAPRDRLRYRYDTNGTDRFRIDDSNAGIGDIRLTGGIQLYDDGATAPRRVALRSALKLPTGDSDKLRGSGSVDFALWLAASDDYRLGDWGHLTLFANAGGTVMGDGDVLGDQQRNLAAMGTFGFGWSPLDWMALTVQTTWHSSLYEGSDLREISTNSLLMTGGFSFAFTERTFFDIALSEDLNVKTSPDVNFHLALRQRF
ncbi:hypothetical protein Gmet_0353 [Geobacter metallireducens GS-15]|uniref:DUF3187 family protein n=1 Tax=Geobacter metallireducens (strain ATCC 53774 / DSM 7210 / GS-15) TaxID=269799 RepID=Q39YS8_GEOMG|nr:DUF3187 family protein [Geobacter metallireducens]ABB30596.1 hypothetical protein Gmet_0353 [Geobacter metallireducens GS-15]